MTWYRHVVCIWHGFVGWVLTRTYGPKGEMWRFWIVLVVCLSHHPGLVLKSMHHSLCSKLWTSVLIILLLIGYTCTQWILYPWPFSPPTLVKGGSAIWARTLWYFPITTSHCYVFLLVFCCSAAACVNPSACQCCVSFGILVTFVQDNCLSN